MFQVLTCFTSYFPVDRDAIMDQAPLVDNDFVRVPKIGSEPE